MSGTSLRDAKNLLTQGDHESRTKRIERIIEDLRSEFDTLHRVCRIILEDLERLESRLDQSASKEDCDRTKLDMAEKTKKLADFTDTITKLEARIYQLEQLLFKNFSPVVNITNTGAAIGNDVNGNVTT